MARASFTYKKPKVLASYAKPSVTSAVGVDIQGEINYMSLRVAELTLQPISPSNFVYLSFDDVVTALDVPNLNLRPVLFLVDSVDMSDMLSLSSTASLSLLDAVATGDSAQSTAGALRTLQDSVGTGDAITMFNGLVVDHQDTLSVTETLTLDFTAQLVPAESVSMSDAYQLQQPIDRGPFEAVSASDTTSLAMQMLLDVQDTVNILDAVNARALRPSEQVLNKFLLNDLTFNGELDRAAQNSAVGRDDAVGAADFILTDLFVVRGTLLNGATPNIGIVNGFGIEPVGEPEPEPTTYVSSVDDTVGTTDGVGYHSFVGLTTLLNASAINQRAL